MNSAPAYWTKVKLAGTGSPCNSMMAALLCFFNYASAVEEFLIHRVERLSRPMEQPSLLPNQISKLLCWINGVAREHRVCIRLHGTSKFAGPNVPWTLIPGWPIRKSTFPRSRTGKEPFILKAHVTAHQS